jgi:hypothetical protein
MRAASAILAAGDPLLPVSDRSRHLHVDYFSVFWQIICQEMFGSFRDNILDPLLYLIEHGEILAIQ